MDLQGKLGTLVTSGAAWLTWVLAGLAAGGLVVGAERLLTLLLAGARARRRRQQTAGAAAASEEAQPDDDWPTDAHNATRVPVAAPEPPARRAA